MTHDAAPGAAAPDVTALPAFDDLPVLPKLGLRHAWGVFGEDDVLGTANLLTPDRVLAGTREVTTGAVIPLDLPVDQPDPPLFGRSLPQHTVIRLNGNEFDERLDGYYPQSSTQWDALAHVRCREFGFWGGRTHDPTEGGHELGIQALAEHGIVGRAVLADVERWAASTGRPLDALAPVTVSADDLQATLDHQGTVLEPGDILCVRLGWIGAYRALDQAGREALAERPDTAGLLADEAMARFLWDRHVAVLCCDNPAVEKPYGDPAVGSLHRRLMPLLGMTLGELFDFEALGPACADRGRWSFLLSAAPLRVPGGVGSPGNAVAIL